MAAYQCLNCGQIERSDVDCCENPDLMKINDMPAEIKRLRAALEAATRPANPSAVEVIPLSDGNKLILAERYPAGKFAWLLSAEDGTVVRVLNEYEAGFVNAALCAGHATVKHDRYAWHQYMDHGNGMGWIEHMTAYDPRTPDYAELHHGVDWADPKQVRNFRALYTKPQAQTV